MIGGNERINLLEEASQNHCALIDVLNQDSTIYGLMSSLSRDDRRVLVDLVDKMEARVSFNNRSPNVTFNSDLAGWIGISTTPTGIELTDGVAYLDGRNDAQYLKTMYSALFLNKEMLSRFFNITTTAGKVTLTPKTTFPRLKYRFPIKPEHKLWFHHIIEGTRLEAAMKADDQIGWILRLLTIGNFCEPMACMIDRNLAYLRIYQAFGVNLESPISPYRTNDEHDSVFGLMPKERGDRPVTHAKFMEEVNGYNDHDRGFYLNGLSGNTIHFGVALNIYKQGQHNRLNLHSPANYPTSITVPSPSFVELFRNKSEWESGVNKNILKEYGNLTYTLAPPGFKSNLARTSTYGEERALSERMDRVLNENSQMVNWYAPGNNPILGINTTAPEWLIIEQDFLTGYVTLRNQHPNKYVYFTVGGLELPVPPKKVCVINPESFNQYILVKELPDKPKGYRTGFDLMYKERWKRPSGDDSVGYSDTCYFPPINFMPIRPDREPSTLKLRVSYGFGGMGCGNFMINVDDATKVVKNASVRWFGTPISAFFRKNEVVNDFLQTSFMARKFDANLKLDLNLIKGLLLPSNTNDTSLKGKFVYYMRTIGEATEDVVDYYYYKGNPLVLGNDKVANTVMSFSLLPSSVYLPEGVQRIASGHHETTYYHSMPGFIYWSEREKNWSEELNPQFRVRDGHWLERRTYRTDNGEYDYDHFHENIEKERLMTTMTSILHEDMTNVPTETRKVIDVPTAINLDLDNILDASEPVRFTFKGPIIAWTGWLRRYTGTFTVDEINAFGGVASDVYQGVPGIYFIKNNVGRVAGNGITSRFQGHLIGGSNSINNYKMGPIHPGVLEKNLKTKTRFIANTNGMNFNNMNQPLSTDYCNDLDETRHTRWNWRAGFGTSPWWFAIDFFIEETSSMRPAVKSISHLDLVNYTMPSTFKDFVWLKPSCADGFANSWHWTSYSQTNLVGASYFSHRNSVSSSNYFVSRWRWEERYPGTDTVYPAFVSLGEMDTYDRYGKLLKYRTQYNLEAKDNSQTYWNPILSTYDYDFIIPCDGSIVVNYSTTLGEMGTMTHSNSNDDEYGSWFTVETGTATSSLSFVHVRKNKMELYQFPYGVSAVHIKRSSDGLRIINDFSTSYQGWLEQEPYIKRTISPDNPLETSTYWFIKVLIASNFAIGIDRISLNSDYFKRFVGQESYSQYLHPGLIFYEVKGELHQRSINSANPRDLALLPFPTPNPRLHTLVTNCNRGNPGAAGKKWARLFNSGPVPKKYLVPQVLNDKYSGIVFRGAGYEHYQNNRIYYKDLFGTSQSVQFFKLLGNSYIRMVGRIPERTDPATGRQELYQRPVIFELKGEAEVWYWGLGSYYGRISRVKIKDGFRWTNNGLFAYYLTGSDDMNLVDEIDKENCIGINGGKWELIKAENPANSGPYYQYDERVLGSKEDANSVYFNPGGYLFLKDTEALWGEQKQPKPKRPLKLSLSGSYSQNTLYFRTTGPVRRYFGNGKSEVITKTREEFVKELPLLNRLYNPVYDEVEEHCAYVPIVFKNGTLSLSIPWVTCSHGDEKVMSYSGTLNHFYGKHYYSERAGELVMPTNPDKFAGEKREVRNATKHSRFTSDGYFRGALHRAERTWYFYYMSNQYDTWAKNGHGRGDDSAVFHFNNYRAKCVNDFNVKDFKLQIEPFFPNEWVTVSLFRINVFEGITYISIRKPIYIRLDLSKNHSEFTLFNIQAYKGKVIINLEAPIYIETINPRNNQITVYNCNINSYRAPEESVVEFLNYSPDKIIINNGKGAVYRERFGTNRGSYNF